MFYKTSYIHSRASLGAGEWEAYLGDLFEDLFEEALLTQALLREARLTN